MPARSANARWEGDLAGGNGTMNLGTGSWSGPYSAKSRFEEGDGTNPEELIAAAHAACFTMALSFALAREGLSEGTLATTAKVKLDKDGDGFKVSRSDLTLEARVPGIDEDRFRTLAESAKAGCPISKLLNAEIGFEYRLET
jgi:lipoyl-dependent peroxiredoxin